MTALSFVGSGVNSNEQRHLALKKKSLGVQPGSYWLYISAVQRAFEQVISKKKKLR